MKAQFEPGDKVRVVNPEGGDGSLLYGAEHTVAHLCTESYTPNCRVHHLQLEGMGNIWWDQVRFEKVEALWTVGDKVSGGDYPRLPIGSVVFDEPAAEDTVASVPVLKTGEDEWTNQGWPGVFTNAEMADDVRTLTRLGDGTPPAKCTGEGGCQVEVHYHGCYADVPPAKCDDPSEHGTQTEVEPERDFLCCAAPSHIHGRIVMPTGERVETTLTVPPATADVEPEPLKEEYARLRRVERRITDVLDAWKRQPCHMTGEAAATILRRVMEEANSDTVTEPEDADDAYVEAEPLTLVEIDTLDREEIHRLIACLPVDWGLIEPDGSVVSEVINEVSAALLEFANPVKSAQCTSLLDMSDSVRIQCAKDANVLVHMHRAVYAGVEVRWPDDEAYGRVEVSS